MNRRNSGFALVITVVLLSLLVLALFGTSALTRVSIEVATTGGYQVQARQNALLGLSVALGEMQAIADDETAITGMGGVLGLPVGPGSPARQWAVVWDGRGDFRRWLASGATGVALPNLIDGESIALVAAGSVGADGADKEHVRVRRIPVFVPGADGVPMRQGSYAWWVGDEGVKLSAVIPDADGPVTGQKHALDELIPALSPSAANLSRVEAYGQLALVPTDPLTPGQLQANFHVLGRAHRRVTPHGAVAGLLNVNSTAARYWRGVAATYNRLKPSTAPAIGPSTFADWMRDHFAAEDPDAGKGAGQPFSSVEAFCNSALLGDALERSGGTRTAFADTMRSWLVVRSDTFRVRAYGDAANPAAGSRVEATAWCEATVQRTAADDKGPTRYLVSSFRWLGPDEI